MVGVLRAGLYNNLERAISQADQRWTTQRLVREDRKMFSQLYARKRQALLLWDYALEAEKELRT